MKTAYLGIKFYEDQRNIKLINDISKVLEELNYKAIVVVRDYQKLAPGDYSPEKLMKLAFKLIDKSDIMVLEMSEKGVGLGIEAGYAYAKDIPIIVIAKEGSDISETLVGIAKKIIYYKESKDLSKMLEGIK